MVGTTAHDMEIFYLFVRGRKTKDFNGRMGTWQQSREAKILRDPRRQRISRPKRDPHDWTVWHLGLLMLFSSFLPRTSRNTDQEDDENNKNNLTSSPNKFFFRKKSGFHLNSRGDRFFFGSIIVYYKLNMCDTRGMAFRWRASEFKS